MKPGELRTLGCRWEGRPGCVPDTECGPDDFMCSLLCDICALQDTIKTKDMDKTISFSRAGTIGHIQMLLPKVPSALSGFF